MRLRTPFVTEDRSATSSEVRKQSEVHPHFINLVDPASSHMLVSRTKPRTSQSKRNTVGLCTAHYISYNLTCEAG